MKENQHTWQKNVKDNLKNNTYIFIFYSCMYNCLKINLKFFYPVAEAPILDPNLTLQYILLSFEGEFSLKPLHMFHHNIHTITYRKN